MSRPRRGLVVALAGALLLALVTWAVPALAQDAPAAGGDALGAWGVPAGLGGALGLPFATWMVLRALGLWPPPERRSQQPGRRAADEEASLALKILTEESWQGLQTRLASIEQRLASLEAWQRADELAAVEHRGDHRELSAEVRGLRLAVEAVVGAAPSAG